MRLTEALTINMTAFESHEKTEQDNFFTLTSVWDAVKILDRRQQMTMDVITGEIYKYTRHCFCLISNCVSVKALMASYMQAAGCLLAVSHIWLTSH